MTGKAYIDFCPFIELHRTELGVDLNQAIFLALKCTDNSGFTDAKNPTGISNTAAIHRHLNSLFFYASLIRLIAVFKPKCFDVTAWIIATIARYAMDAVTYVFYAFAATGFAAHFRITSHSSYYKRITGLAHYPLDDRDTVSVIHHPIQE